MANANAYNIWEKEEHCASKPARWVVAKKKPAAAMNKELDRFLKKLANAEAFDKRQMYFPEIFPKA